MSTPGVGQSSNIQHRQNVFGKGGTVKIDGVKYSYSGKITDKNQGVLDEFAKAVKEKTFKGKEIFGDVKFSSVSKGPFAKISSFVKNVFKKMGSEKTPKQENQIKETKQESVSKTNSHLDSTIVQDSLCKTEMENILKSFVKTVNENFLQDEKIPEFAKNSANKFSEYLEKNEKNLGNESKTFLNDLKKLVSGGGSGDADNLNGILNRDSGSTHQLRMALRDTIGKKLGWE